MSTTKSPSDQEAEPSSPRHGSILCVLVVGVCLAGPAAADVFFPADSGILDVTDFGALPDDGVDDTAAINALLSANPSGNKIFYFPDGVYDLSGSLAPALDDGVTKRNIFQGRSRDGVVLKLQDGLGFTGSVIDYNLNATLSPAPAQFFRNAVRDLTVDIGSGNPGATGILFNASNQGTIRNVTVRSDDGAGANGILTGSGEPGPLLIQNVEVDGFDVGLRTILPTASQTIEHLVLRNQGSFGWLNDLTQTVFARGVVSENAEIPAVRNNDQSRMLLIDSTLTNTGAAGAGNAVVNNKAMYLRNVAAPGYGNVVLNALVAGRGNDREGPDHTLVEFWANGSSSSRRGGTFELFDSPDTTLGLTVKEHPVRAYAPLSEWDGPQNHLIDLGGGLVSGMPNDGVDDTAAIQAAIDSGASTIYLPNGTWTLEGQLRVDANVERFLGAEARMTGSGTIQVHDGEADLVIFERMEGLRTIEHLSARDIAVEHVLGLDYDGTADLSGDVYLNDVTGGKLDFVPGQRVWARQLNLEGNPDTTDDDLTNDAKLVNDGARVWVLGMKVEGPGTWVKTVNGGMTELLGAVKVGAGGFTNGADNARFVTVDSSLSTALAVLAGTQPAPAGYEYFASETRDGQTLLATWPTFAEVYAGFDAEAIAPREVILDNTASRVTVVGDWTADSDAFPGGFVDEDVLFTTPGTGKSVEFRPDMPVAGPFEVFIRWLPERSGQSHSGHASAVPVKILTADELVELTVDMSGSQGGGYWHSLGIYNFEAGTDGAVTIFAEGANGVVMADAARWVLIPEPALLALLGVGGLTVIRRRR